MVRYRGAGYQPFESLVSRVGSPIKDTAPPHVSAASVDAIRHFARAYGDGNPIYSDPVYALGSVRGGLFAPPLFPLATGTPRLTDAGAAGDAVDLDHLPGSSGQTILDDHWLLLRPIGEGTRLSRDKLLHSAVLDRASAGNTSCVVTERTTYTADGTAYAVRDRSRKYWATPVPASPKGTIERTAYSPQQLSDVGRAYDTEFLRGAEPLHIEDVVVGDTIGPMVKGPLTVTDLVEYRSGVGPGPLGGEALRLAHVNRRRRPELYAPDDWGVPDIVERRHWDEKFAESLGLVSAADYSHTRTTWFSHLVTNWIGDGGWLRELVAVTNLGLNYVGDTHWMEGRVTSVASMGPEGHVGQARLALRGHNQRGELTCRGQAVVILPRQPVNVVTPQDLELLGDVSAWGGTTR